MNQWPVSVRVLLSPFRVCGCVGVGVPVEDILYHVTLECLEDDILNLPFTLASVL